MANVAFKKGLLANLPNTHTEGTFYVTTDERAIYLDISDSARVRLGDFQEFATVAALEANTNPSTTALYYVTEINCLAKWDGSKYVQINLDTGATSVEVTGSGNAITGATYDAATRKITFTKGETYMTSGDVDNKIAALDLANTYDAKGTAAQALADAKTYADGKDAAIAAAKKAGDDAQSDVDALENLVGTIPLGATATTVVGYAKELADAAEEAATYDDTALKARVKTIEDDYLKAADKTELAGRIKAVEDDYLTSADKTELETSIGTKQDELGFEGTYDKSSNKVVTRAYMENAISGLTGAVHFIGVKTELPATSENGDICIVGNKEYVYSTSDNKWHELGDETIYAVKGEIADADVDANAAIAQSKIAGLTNDIARIGVIEGKESGWDTAASKAAANEAAITAIKDGTNIDSFADVETALSGKQNTIPANTYDAYGSAAAAQAAAIAASDSKGSAAAAEQNAKDYADSLASNYDAAGAAANVQTAVTGTAQDDEDDLTLYGLRAYADAAVSSGLTWGSF